MCRIDVPRKCRDAARTKTTTPVFYVGASAAPAPTSCHSAVGHIKAHGAFCSPAAAAPVLTQGLLEDSLRPGLQIYCPVRGWFCRNRDDRREVMRRCVFAASKAVRWRCSTEASASKTTAKRWIAVSLPQRGSKDLAGGIASPRAKPPEGGDKRYWFVPLAKYHAMLKTAAGDWKRGTECCGCFHSVWVSPKDPWQAVSALLGEPMTHHVYIAMGSNLGDREATLREAVRLMRQHPAIVLRRQSRFYQTDPLGPPGQGKYLNAAVEIETALAPPDLLAALQEIERRLGRDRSKEIRWGPRTCDLDILPIDRQVIDTPELTVPHPRMHERPLYARTACRNRAGRHAPSARKNGGSDVSGLEGRGTRGRRL